MGLVARGRFELPSAGPKPAMLVHYTTGLRDNISRYNRFVGGNNFNVGGAA